jgi:nicotinamidase/pyrazinamidase
VKEPLAPAESPQRRPALIVVDVQNDFCPGGALAVPGGDRVVPVLSSVARRFEAAGHPVYASRDWHPPDTTHFRTSGGPWPPHCIAGSAGAALHPDLRLPASRILVSKGQDGADAGYSAFDGVTDDGRRLEEDLRERQVSELVVGGLATDYCVRATVLDARRAGFPVTVILDGVAGIEPQDAARALDDMRRAGALVRASADLFPDP